MKCIRLFIPVLGLLLLFSACKPKKETASGPSPDSTFAKMADEFLDGYFTFRPGVATYVGLHQYDRAKRDYSKAGLAAELDRLKAFEQKLAPLGDSLSPKARFDHKLLLAAIHQEIFAMEDLGIYTKNPMTYAGSISLNIFAQRDFAPLKERVKSVIAIEDQTPAIFAAARENLADSLAKPYVETAILIARGGADFLEKELVEALAQGVDDTLRTVFNAANKKAIGELRGFATWLEKEKLSKVHNRYAIGKANYKKMLLYNEMLDVNPEDILTQGLAELKKEQELFAQVAKVINPNKKAIDVFEDLKKDHPKAENLIPDARKNLETIRQFLLDKKIITVPSEVRVEVKETPQFARSTSTASMDTPGPFEKATQAFYYITPTEKTWSAKQKEEWLSQFSYYVTDIISVHEAYPGHYVQFLHLNASPTSKIQKTFGSYAFVEGWAHYTEKMMIEEGFGAKDPITQAKYHLAQLDESLLRLCRLCVSIKTHTEGMTLADATKFIEDNAYYAYKPAYQEALRGTFDPGYLSYTLGKLQILKLREEYKAQEGENFSLQKFHDQLLDNGMPPVTLLREVLLKNPTAGTSF